MALMILWAAHDGGYDADTWYWGALAVLGLLVLVAARIGTRLTELDRAVQVALLAFGAYVAWSYLSISWAASPGDALTGSNRALLYLLVFALLALSQWTAERAMGAALLWTLAVGVLGFLILVAMASGHNVPSMFSEGRLVSPTGYFNSSAALFTSAALVAVALATRKELPSLLRGVLLAIACEGVQLALIGESRGWLFTLPFVLLAAVAVVHDRLRTAAFAILPLAAALINLPSLLDVFRSTDGAHPTPMALLKAAEHAGTRALLISLGVLVLGTLLAAADARRGAPVLGPRSRRWLGTAAIAIALIATVSGAVAATHGHPIRFVKRQLNGFTHPEGSSSSSHFAVVGSGRYDIWRTSLKAVGSHPIGGLGQDNFAEYYLRHRHTDEEVQWTHSFELRLLAHTGVVGFCLFGAFLAAGLLAAVRNRRRAGPLAGPLAGLCLLPLVVWLVHGSVDWFWENPALTGPALGFLAVAASLRGSGRAASSEDRREHGHFSRSPRLPRAVTAPLAAAALGAAVFALGFPYLSARKVSTASDIRVRNPQAALRDLEQAAELNPLSADPGRLGGTIALQSGNFIEAEHRFRQAISRQPAGWFSWLGDGLAASALGDSARAHHDFAVAASINSRQPAVSEALARVDSRHPLTPPEAFRLFVLAH